MVKKYGINEVIVASDKIYADNLKVACAACEDLGIAMRNLELSIK